MEKIKAALKKAWNFVKENKKVIIFATTVAGGTILLATIEANRIGKEIVEITKPQAIPIPTYKNVEYESKVGKIAEAFVSDNEAEILINCVKPEDLGKLGEEIINNIPEIPPDKELSLWINAFALTPTNNEAV